MQTLCVPVQASWLRTADAIDFVRAVAPRLAFAIHDGQINDRGLTSLNGWLTEESRTDYRWPPPRSSINAGVLPTTSDQADQGRAARSTPPPVNQAPGGPQGIGCWARLRLVAGEPSTQS